MLPLIRSWIVPSYEDEDINRRAFLLNVMAWLSLLLTLAVNSALVVTTIQNRDNSGLIIAIITMVVSLAWIAGILFFSHHGRVSLGSHLLLWGGVVFGLLTNVLDPKASMEDPSWYIFTVIVVAAALLLGARWSLGFAGVETALFLASHLLQNAGYIHGASEEPPPNIPYSVAMIGSILFCLAALSWLFASGLERALHRARQQATELAEAKGQLESTQAYLEQTVERTVADYSSFAQRVAAGDLTICLQLPKEDTSPLVILGKNLNAMVEGLWEISAQVHDAAGKVSAVAARILTATSQQVAGTGEQSEAISQASATISEVRAIAEQTAQRAQGVADSAQQTAQVSQSGQQAVVETVKSMGQVRDRVASIAGDILSLSEQTQTIGAITTMLKQIASQSNLLALNAAVEAARAGEAGKGFAVVAGEVRNMAGQSRAATERVREILTDIQHGVETAVQATEEGRLRTEAGVKLSGEAGESIRRLAESVGASTQSALQIAAAAGQQLTGMEQIAQVMGSIQRATAQTVAGAQEMESAAAELDRLAGKLHEAVERYRF